MNKEQFEIIQTINFLKGLTVRFEQHKKEDLIINFINSHKELIPYFEKSQVLSYGIQHNTHTKKLTQIFVESEYDVNNDYFSPYYAIKNKHFKSMKMIIDQGYDINHVLHGETIINILLKQINLKTSNSTLRKINKILLSIDLNSLEHTQLLNLEKQIQIAQKNLIILNHEFSHFTNDIISEFNSFIKKYDSICFFKNLKSQLNTHNDFSRKKNVLKI